MLPYRLILVVFRVRRTLDARGIAARGEFCSIFFSGRDFVVAARSARLGRCWVGMLRLDPRDLQAGRVDPPDLAVVWC